MEKYFRDAHPDRRLDFAAVDDYGKVVVLSLRDNNDRMVKIITRECALALRDILNQCFEGEAMYGLKSEQVLLNEKD